MLCTAFVYNSQSSNGIQNIMSKLFKHYKLLTKAVWPYATLKASKLNLPRNGRRLRSLENKHDALEKLTIYSWTLSPTLTL